MHALKIRLALPLAALVLASASASLVPAQRPDTGFISGTISGPDGRPWPDIVINLYTGNTMEASVKTADDGKYRVELPPGIHNIQVIQDYARLVARPFPIYAGTETRGDINFHDFNDDHAAVQAHYGAGEKSLKLAESIRDQLDDEATVSKQKTLEAKMASAADKAVAEFQKALSATDPQNSFFDRFFVLNFLGQAYDDDGKHKKAVECYQKALAFRQDAAVYDSLGNALAKAGDLPAANTAYQKSMELDPSSTSTGRAYRDLGISLYNADHLAEALSPLRTSTQLDPANPQGWYVLGAVLVGTMEKRSPGAALPRAEREALYREALAAYQKAIELDAAGKWHAKGEAGMRQLQEISQETGGQDAHL